MLLLRLCCVLVLTLACTYLASAQATVLFQSDGSSLAPFVCDYGQVPANPSVNNTDGLPAPSLQFSTPQLTRRRAAPYVLPGLKEGQVFRASQNVKFETSTGYVALALFGLPTDSSCHFPNHAFDPWPIPSIGYRIERRRADWTFTGASGVETFVQPNGSLDLAIGVWHAVEMFIYPNDDGTSYWEVFIDGELLVAETSYESIADPREVGFEIGIPGQSNPGALVKFDNMAVEVSHSASSDVVLSSNSIWLKQNSSVVSGNVVVADESAGPTLASGVELTVGDSAEVASGSELRAHRIKVKTGAVVDSDVYYNELYNNGTIHGSLSFPLDLPVVSLPSFESAPAGTLDILVEQGGYSTLPPGDYGDVQVKKNGKLLFLGGEYNVRSINGGQTCQLLFADASVVHVEERFDTDKNSMIGPDTGASIDASDIVFYVAGINGSNGNLGATPKAAQLGLSNTANANFYVPNGTLWIRQNTDATGAFIGKDVIVGIGATISHDSAF